LKILDLRSQFTIFVFLPESYLTTDFKQNFVSSGYDTHIFIDLELMLERIRESAPHVVLFSTELQGATLSQFTESILKINPEIQFACVAPASSALQLNDYREFNFAQILQPGEQFLTRALWTIDSICERLAYQYQNEALVEQVTSLRVDLQHRSVDLDRLQNRMQKDHEKFPQVTTLLERFGHAASKEDFVQAFLNHLIGKKSQSAWTAVYFKFLPSVISFIATQGHQIDLERTKGVGAKLTNEELVHLTSFLRQRKLPNSMDRLMKEAFQIEKYAIFPLFLRDQVEGLLVVWGTECNEGDWAEFLLFQLCYQNAHLQKKLDAVEVLDPITELHNKSFFYLRLDEEVNRAKRLIKPASVVRLALDSAQQIDKAIGITQRNLIMRSISMLVKKTSRINDYACRTGETEISLILPHCSKKGAALRAERLRRAVETHAFSAGGLKVTVSFGVSEYPSHCSSSEDLDQSATQALQFIVGQGGNKVCMYKPVEDFKPDFEVSSV
jgi:diguanylate cyclase (GGDEF)-like protein